MAPGSISIGGNTFPIAVGAAAFTGASVTPGANVCLTATLNGLGQITGGTVAANTITGTTTPLNVCGTLSSYTPAGTSTTGTVAFSAPTASSYVIVANTTIGNYSSSLLNTTVCLVGQLLNGQIVSASFVPQVVTTVTVCGQVTAYSAATTGATATAGLITIGGTTLGIAPNTTFSGASITQNSFYCIAATLNALQQITAGTVTQVTTTATPTATGTPATATATATATTVPSTLVICGLVTVYTAATSSAAGTITIAGTTVAIAPGAVITGTTLGANANVCISATLNSSQQITNAAVAVNTATATATATIPANIPSPPPPPGGPATATPTATATPVPPTATATAAPPTNTPVPPAPTNTPKPKKPTATATAPAPSAPSPAAPSPSAPKPVPAPKTLPSTGFGGLNSSVAHNAAMGRVYRATNGKAALAAEPQTGGGNPISPAVPVVLGLLAIGLGVLSRRFVFGKR
jgi:hypothetical protein